MCSLLREAQLLTPESKNSAPRVSSTTPPSSTSLAAMTLAWEGSVLASTPPLTPQAP